MIPGDNNLPVNYVTFYDAIRFANWLDNGQVPGSTETGAYTLLGGTPTPSNDNAITSITRNAVATVFLPSENEWYKAAFYNPKTSSYFQYPTSSNLAPTATGPTSTPNSANYNITEHALTDVGAYSGTTSPYGAYDMGGDVWQWNDTVISAPYRGLRGSAWDSSSAAMVSSYRNYLNPPDEISDVGFRVACIHEPSTLVLIALGGVALWMRRRRP